MRKLVLFVEGEGEADSVPRLVKRLLTEQDAWDAVTLDPSPFRVGQVNKLLKDACVEWRRKLRACSRRGNVGAVLLLLDGDVDVGGRPLCAASEAHTLIQSAQMEGAGKTFSVAIVFALSEFETWLLAGVESLAGKRLPDGRTVAADARAPDEALESCRDAKKRLGHFIERGYKEVRDQTPLTELVDIGTIRGRNLRSFRRLEHAVAELVMAIRTNAPVATPAMQQ